MKPKMESFSHFLPEDTTGFSVHKNPRNGFVVIGLDYVADPKKRDLAWINKEKLGMSPKQWAVEMERSWDTYNGKPVYEKVFYKHIHVLLQAVGPQPFLPIFRGWDFGGNHSVVIAQIIGPRLIVLDEIPNAGTNTLEFVPKVISFCNNQYGFDYKYIDVIDPNAMWDTNRSMPDAACADVMRKLGLHPIPASTNDPQKRIIAVTELLMRLVEGKPCLQLNPQCITLIKGFEAAYHYSDRPTQGRGILRPVKNLYSNIHDALQYLALRMKAHTQPRKDEELAYEASLVSQKYKFGQ